MIFLIPALFYCLGVFEGFDYSLVKVSHLPQVQEKQITPTPFSFPNGTKNLANFITTINASSRQTNKTNSFEKKKYRREMQKLESNMEVEDETKSAISKSPIANPVLQLTEINTVTTIKLVNYMNSDDLLTSVEQSKSLDYRSDLKDLNAPGAITEILTFLSIAAGICFLAYIVYLYRCKKSHNRHCIETEKYIDVAHLKIEKVKIGTIHSDIPDALW